MRRILVFLSVVSLFSAAMFCGSCSTNMKTPDEQAIYQIGDRGPGEGWIFYDKGTYSDGWRYLEVSSTEQAYIRKWGCKGTAIKDARHTGVGTGKTNTLAIIKSCDQPIIAANIAVSYSGGDKSDWFLPSIDELRLMYENLYMHGIGEFDDTCAYWSSSEENSDFAIGFLFKPADGKTRIISIKKEGGEDDGSPQVRAIRQF